MRESTRRLDQIERLLGGLERHIQERRESDERSDDAVRSEITAQAETAAFLADQLIQVDERIETIERMTERQAAAAERSDDSLRGQITRQLELTSDALRRLDGIEGALRDLAANRPPRYPPEPPTETGPTLIGTTARIPTSSSSEQQPRQKRREAGQGAATAAEAAAQTRGKTHAGGS